jgi:hypothetical protein
MTPTFQNSDSTLSPNFLWKKSEMIDEIKEHKALIVFFGVNKIFLVKFELLDKSNTLTTILKEEMILQMLISQLL